MDICGLAVKKKNKKELMGDVFYARKGSLLSLKWCVVWDCMKDDALWHIE